MNGFGKPTLKIEGLPNRLDIPVGFKLSPALRRLVEDVRREKAVGSSSPTSYDRIHSRHNRST